jgi:hypothetical protein
MNSDNKTIVGSILVDCSLSMELILPTLITSLKTFIDEIKSHESTSSNCYFRLSTFSNKRNNIFPNTLDSNSFGNIKDIGKDHVKFKTQGCTRLHDSAIEEIDILSDKLHSLKGENVKSWFVLLTDGYDNMSASYASVLEEKVIDLKKRDVNCIFMGANIDAKKHAAFFGFDESKTVQVDLNVHENHMDAPLFQCFRALSDNITQVIENDLYNMEFTPVQRAQSAPSHFNTQKTQPTQNDDDYLINLPPPTLQRH